MCGTNVKSGETFDMKIKRAQSKEGHSERYVRHIFLATFLGFGLVILAGFFTEKGAEEFIKQHPEQFREYAEQMAVLDTLIAKGETDKADKLGEEMIKSLEKDEQELKEGPSYSHNPTSKAKKFMVNLRKVVQHKLEDMR